MYSIIYGMLKELIQTNFSEIIVEVLVFKSCRFSLILHSRPETSRWNLRIKNSIILFDRDIISIDNLFFVKICFPKTERKDFYLLNYRDQYIQTLKLLRN